MEGVKAFERQNKLIRKSTDEDSLEEFDVILDRNSSWANHVNRQYNMHWNGFPYLQLIHVVDIFIYAHKLRVCTQFRNMPVSQRNESFLIWHLTN